MQECPPARGAEETVESSVSQRAKNAAEGRMVRQEYEMPHHREILVVETDARPDAHGQLIGLAR